MEIQGVENLAQAASGSQILNKVFVVAIRLYTPAYIINREIADDLVCVVKDKEGSVLSRKKFAKGDMLLAGPTFAGRDPHQYENPGAFDPDRYQTLPTYLSWIPFGEGMHSCPGQWLAKTEILLFTAALLQRYRIQSFPNAEMKLKGYMTLKTDQDIELILSPK